MPGLDDRGRAHLHRRWRERRQNTRGFDRTRQTYLRHTNGKLGGRPELESENLLANVVTPGDSEAPYTVPITAEIAAA